MMSVSLRDVTVENWRAVARLSDQLSEEQRKFVTHNAISMLDYHFDQDTLGQRAIYADDTAIGYMLYGRDEVDAHVWWIIRLMIAPAVQRMGYGREAMKQIMTLIKAQPNCQSICISFAPANNGARHLYEQLGFTDTGRVEDGELVFRLDLA